MANEYQDLGVVYDENDIAITVKRIYQENGGRGIEIVVEKSGFIVDVHQSLNVVPRV